MSTSSENSRSSWWTNTNNAATKKVLLFIGLLICMLVISLFTEERTLKDFNVSNYWYGRSSQEDDEDRQTVITTSGGAECLSLDKLDAIISNSRQVFIAMPAKAAGSSLIQFTNKCLYPNQTVTGYDINKPMRSKDLLTSSFEVPSIITSHMYDDEPLVDLAQESTRQTLIVYIHRDETERLLSGIRFALTSRVCSPDGQKLYVGNTSRFNIVRNNTHCILDEMPVVDLIENRVQEVGLGSPEILTCKAYEAIEQNAPNMIFMHYKQADKLQKLLAKHHCPELMEEPSRVNTAKGKGSGVFLRLKEGAGIVNLDEWLEEKGPLFEWSLKLKKHASCQAKTRHMEDDLFACSDQTIMVSDIQHW